MKRLFLLIALLAASPALAQNPTQSPTSLPITGAAKVELIPFGKLIDTFNDPSVLDTTGNWSAPTTGGTGSATYSQGQEVLSSGTTAGSFALLTSQSTFQITAPAFLMWRGAINSQIEIAGTCKEMGLFIAAGSPTCNAPVTDGILFEITAETGTAATSTQNRPGGGKLQAVTYASGTRQVIADLSIPVSGISWGPIFNPADGSILCPARTTPQPSSPSDTCPHILDIWFNGNSAEFDVDFKPVAYMLAGNLGPNNNLLRWSALAINASGSVATTIKINQAVVGDEARNSLRLCDPTYPTRCVTVSSSGAISTLATAPVGITPTDRTITSASGSSQQLAAANASRHSLTIENTGNANCGVNPTGGTAVIGGAGTITLAPLGSYSPAIPTLSAITIICTAGQPIYGNES